MQKSIEKLFSLEGKCAAVFGGKGKVGLPMVVSLAECGARVYVISPSTKIDDEVFQKYQIMGLDIHGVSADQSNEEQVSELVETIKKDYKCPDILINCGVSRPMKKYLKDTPESWMESMRVNSLGLFVTCRKFANEMSKNNGGSIINISSIYGIVAPDKLIYEDTDLNTEPDYPYTKGGMIMFSKYLASYYAENEVRVNCIAPGGLFNNQDKLFYNSYLKKVPMRRMANENDMKGVAVFLASDASRYITGTVIPVDGGFTVI